MIVLGIDPAFEGIALLPTVEGKMTTSNDPTERSDGGSLTQSFYPRLLVGLQCSKTQEQCYNIYRLLNEYGDLCTSSCGDERTSLRVRFAPQERVHKSPYEFNKLIIIYL